MRGIVALAAVALLLGSCGEATRRTSAATEMGYLHRGPLFLATRTTEIERAAAGPLAEAAYLWAQDRLQPSAGGEGLARFVVTRVDIRERPYGGPSGRDQGIMTRALRYQAEIAAEVQFLTEQRLPRGVAVAHGGSTVLLAEDSSPAEQQRAMDRLIIQAIAGMNEEFERALSRRR